MSIKDSGERTEFTTGAQRDMHAGKGRFDLLPWHAIHDVAKHCEEGALKYGERNVDKGIPQHSFIDSAFRHLKNYWTGETDEHHLRAAAWNILWALEQETTHPELMDLPYRDKKAVFNYDEHMYDSGMEEVMKIPCPPLVREMENSPEKMQETLVSRWVDDADSWYCPVCGYSVGNPLNLPDAGTACPKCKTELDKRPIDQRGGKKKVVRRYECDFNIPDLLDVIRKHANARGMTLEEALLESEHCAANMKRIVKGG